MPRTRQTGCSMGASAGAGPAARSRSGSARTDWDPGPRAGFASGKVVGGAGNLVCYDDAASPPQGIISILCSLSEHKISFALVLGISRCQYLERGRSRTQGCLAWLKYLILSTHLFRPVTAVYLLDPSIPIQSFLFPSLSPRHDHFQVEIALYKNKIVVSSSDAGLRTPVRI
ncbi:hypothetical protein HJG60_008894 [Phyllostomus discolor]|uniref:Uncharacterized protein n=1 Tax=Phyllostomus discolor TaxID=89673 RepID=A0A834DG07_9CHIR|nr:hypothetical protein HJG60_008894 [Phyllostomus discolor]